MSEICSIAHLIRADYAIYTKEDRRRADAAAYGNGPDFLHTSQQFDIAFLDHLRPGCMMQDTAGYFSIDPSSRHDGAWLLAPLGDKVVLSNLRSQNLKADIGLQPGNWEASQRNEFIEQVTLIFDHTDWSQAAPQLLVQGIEWICTTRDLLAKGGAEAISRPMFRSQSDAIYPTRTPMIDDALQVLEHDRDWVGHVDLLAATSWQDLAIALLSQMTPQRRTSLTLGVGFAQKMAGLNIQIYSTRSLALWQIDQSQSLAIRQHIKANMDANRLRDMSDMWLYFPLLLQNIAPAHAELARAMPSVGKADMTLWSEEDLCRLFDLYDLALDISLQKDDLLSSVVAHFTEILSSLLSHYKFLPASVWSHCSNLQQLPFVVGNLLNHSDRALRVALRQSLNLIYFDKATRQNWWPCVQNIRCLKDWSLSHWENEGLSALDLFDFCLYAEEAIQAGGSKYVTHRQLLRILADVGDGIGKLQVPAFAVAKTQADEGKVIQLNTALNGVR